MSEDATKKHKLSGRARLRALGSIAKTTYRASPGAVVMKMAGALITATVPLVIAYFAALTTTALADAFAGLPGAGDRAIEYVVITAALGVVMSAWFSVQNYIDELTAYRINAAVSDRLYEHFVAIEYWRYDDKATADMFDKAQNFALFFSRFFDVIARLFSSFVQAIASVIALATVSWWLGLLLMVAIVPGVIVQIRLSRMQAAHWRKNTEVRRKASGITYSVFQVGNLAELRMYNAAKAMLKLRAKYRDLDQLERISYERKYLGWRIVSDAVEAGAEVASLVTIAWQIVHQAQPIGQFIYVQQLVSRALGGMHALISEFNGIDEDLATMYDYESFMQLPVASTGGVTSIDQVNEISLKDVSFCYPNSSTEVLKHISMTIHQGKHVAIVGENGAGKSTLVKLLMGLYRPTAGEVRVDGRLLEEIDEHEWHRHVSILQQEFIKYHFVTVRENVEYGDVEHEPDNHRYQEALEKAEAREFIEKLPRDHATIPNQWFENDDGSPGIELSGGQWQRLALARSFYRSAPIIILDEPTSAIDALAEARIFKRLFDMKHKTVVTISHRLTTIKRADAVYMLKDGKLVEHGTANELIAKRGEFYRMFESQLT